MASSTINVVKPNGTEFKPISPEITNGQSTSASYSAVVARQPVAVATEPRAFTENNNSTRVFGNAVNTSFRKQGVTFDTLAENVPLEEYLDAVSTYIPSDQMTHVSKVNRMLQLYFTNATWANQLIETGLDIRDFHLDVRPLATAPTKIIISNVPPEISHQWLRGELSRFGRIIGPIKTLSAATNRPQYAHIRSFRRVALIEFADDGALAKLPSQLNFNLQGQPYSFYLSVDVKCFYCKRMGHVRKNCPEKIKTVLVNAKDDVVASVTVENISNNSNSVVTNTSNNDIITPRPTDELDTLSQYEESSEGLPEYMDSLEADIGPKDQELNDKSQTTEETVKADPPMKENKGNASKIKDRKRKVSPNVSRDDFKIFAQEEVIPAPPTSMNTPSEVDQSEDRDSSSQFSESGDNRVLELFDHTTTLSTEELASFLMDVRGSPNRLQHANKYTTNIRGLIEQLQKLHLFLKRSPTPSKTFNWKRVQRVYKGLSQDFKPFS